MRQFLFLMSSLCFVLSCSEQQDPQSYLEVDNIIDLSTELDISIDSDGVPYYEGYAVSKEKFYEFALGYGWSSGIYMYEVIDRGTSFSLVDLEIGEPPFVFDFYLNSSVNLTGYINYYPDSLPYDVLLFKNDDYIYSSDGTVRLSDGSFFMRVVYVSADVIQAFKYLYTDQDGKSHYALCTFRKMTQEKLTEFSTSYSMDYYEYASDSSSNP